MGDVILGISVIREECEREGVKLGHRLPVIFTHGLCHLLGYRHSTPSLTEQVSSLSLVSNSCLFSFQSLPYLTSTFFFTYVAFYPIGRMVFMNNLVTHGIYIYSLVT